MSQTFRTLVRSRLDVGMAAYERKFKDRDAKAAVRLRHLNPQTQEFTIGAKKDHERWNKDDKWHENRQKGGDDPR